MSVIPIVHLDDPRLDVYRQLPTRNLTRQSGRFVVEGRILLQRLLESRLVTESVLAAEGQREALRGIVPAGIPLYLVPDSCIHEVVGFRFHRGALACGLRPAEVDLHAVLLESPRRDELVVCPQILDPTNLGAVIRAACGFGVAAIVLGPGSADPFSRRVVRVSMGTALQVPIVQSRDLTRDLATLRRRWGFQLVGTVLNSEAELLRDARRPDRVAILLGSEGQGLDARWIHYCDRLVTIPMLRGTDSLNLGTAAGIFLYHFTAVARRVPRGDSCLPPDGLQ
jgi:tRNA G18 (ribose-2'-O)-methylase SpoU